MLAPGCYVRAEAVEVDAEHFEEKIVGLIGEFEKQFEENASLGACRGNSHFCHNVA
jgi:hypothetical protein